MADDEGAQIDDSRFPNYRKAMGIFESKLFYGSNYFSYCGKLSLHYMLMACSSAKQELSIICVFNENTWAGLFNHSRLISHTATLSIFSEVSKFKVLRSAAIGVFKAAVETALGGPGGKPSKDSALHRVIWQLIQRRVELEVDEALIRHFGMYNGAEVIFQSFQQVS